MQYTKWEVGHCPHGRIIKVRWQYRDGDGVEDSWPDYSHNGCKACERERAV